MRGNEAFRSKGAHPKTMQRFCFFREEKKFIGFQREQGVAIVAEIFPQQRSMAEKIFENIIFIEEIFADRTEEEIPDVPMLELARSFELKSERGPTP